jgi:AcrR family transcriptional regulator
MMVANRFIVGFGREIAEVMSKQLGSVPVAASEAGRRHMHNQQNAPGPGRRERKAAEMHERIFRAAIELIAERGLPCVTVEQITERADVGKGTFFNYFPNKEAVLTYFGARQVERLRRALERNEVEGPPWERVQQALLVLATYPDMTEELARALFVSALRDTQQTGAETIWQMQGILAAIVHEGQESGAFRADREPNEAALFMLGQYFLALLAWCTGYSNQPLTDTVRAYVSMGLDGLRPV